MAEHTAMQELLESLSEALLQGDASGPDDVPQQALIQSPLFEARQAGQNFYGGAALGLVEKPMMDFLHKVGVAQSQAAADDMERVRMAEFEVHKEQMKLAIYTAWADLEDRGERTSEKMQAVTEHVWNAKKLETRRAAKLKQEATVAEAHKQFQAAVPFCANRHGLHTVLSEENIVCRKIGMFACSKCKSARYCSATCQQMHLSLHQKVGCP
jgi:hypothetical protein